MSEDIFNVYKYIKTMMDVLKLFAMITNKSEEEIIQYLFEASKNYKMLTKEQIWDWLLSD